MKKQLNTLALACLLVLSTSLTGCVKFKQTLTLMPDSSGKIDMSIGLSDQLVQMAEQRGDDPFKDMDPKNLGEEAKGIVAFTKPEKKKEGGYTYLMFSAYFEDINAVELGTKDGDQQPAKFTYTKDGKAATLTIEDSMVLSTAADYKPISPEEKAIATQMTTGMLFAEVYHLPGNFEAIKGVESDGQTAKLEMNQTHMLNGTGPVQDFKGVDKLIFKIAEVNEDEAAMKAFKAELEAAKKEWEAMKKAAEAAE